jgi:hypothetical protein
LPHEEDPRKEFILSAYPYLTASVFPFLQNYISPFWAFRTGGAEETEGRMLMNTCFLFGKFTHFGDANIE